MANALHLATFECRINAMLMLNSILSLISLFFSLA